MYNQVTDRYRFVEVKVIAAPPVLGRKISSVEGYSLQLFRSKEHIHSLGPHNPGSGPVSRTRPKSVQKPPQMKVYNGDVIYRIDMHPHSIPIVGSIKTKDNYVRIYDIILDLEVDDPVLFAKGYSVGKDPVNLAIESFKTAFLNYAAKTEHDQLQVLRPPKDVWNNSLSRDTSMKVPQIRQWNLHEDPKRVETAEIVQEAEKNTLLLKMKAETKKLEEQFDSERNASQHMYQLLSQLSNTAAQELKAILQERIRDTFESGKSFSEVAEETLKLLKVLYKGMGDFTFSNGPNAAMDGAFPAASGTGPDARGTSSGVDGHNSGTSNTPPGGGGTSTDTHGATSGADDSGMAASSAPSASGTSMGTQGTSPEVSGSVPSMGGTSSEADMAKGRDPMTDPAMPALNEPMRKEQEDAGN